MSVRGASVVTMSAALAAAALPALAQGTGNSQVLEFRTLGAAFREILEPDQPFQRDPEALEFDPGSPGNIVPCDLGVRLTDLTEYADPTDGNFPNNPVFLRGSGVIGPNLSRHCDTLPENVNGGGILSGGLASPQSSRTVSTFTTRLPRRTAERDDDDGEATSFAPLDPIAQAFGGRDADASDPAAHIVANVGSLSVIDGFPSGELQLVSDKLSLFASFEYEHLDRDTTEFENAARAETFRSLVGVAYQVAPDIALGVAGRYSFSDGELFQDPVLRVRDRDGNITTTLSFDEACGVPSEGEFESDEFGASLFGTARLGGGGFVSGEIGATKFKQSSLQSRCLFTLDEDLVTASELFAGRIEGEPDGFRISGQILGGVDIPLGPVVIGPRGGLNIDHNRIDSYSEREFAGATTSEFLAVDAASQMIVPTGSALVYDDQEFTSLQSRLGMIAAVPIGVGPAVITPFAEATYVHEFLNHQRDIEVRFAEDFRADATRFSFMNNEPDRDYLEVGGGMDVLVGGLGQANFNAKAIVGNSLFDGYSVNATLRIAF